MDRGRWKSVIVLGSLESGGLGADGREKGVAGWNRKSGKTLKVGPARRESPSVVEEKA